MEYRCVVGKEEKYTIRINHSATTGKASISVNRNAILVLNGRGLRPIGQAVDSLMVSFNIGVKEKHKVSIRARGAFWNHFEVYSDNDVIHRS